MVPGCITTAEELAWFEMVEMEEESSKQQYGVSRLKRGCMPLEQIGERRLNLNSSRQQGLSSIYNTPFQV